MHILLVEPKYYTRYPPLSLLKLSSYHKSKKDTVELVRGEVIPVRKPDIIYITSLFTYAWKPVHSAVRYYKASYPDVEVWLGGIYASLLPEHAALSGADNIHEGLFNDAEMLMPDYSLVPHWNGSILFASRGCDRKCSYCAVPKLEGAPSLLEYPLKDLIYPTHTRIILWDNNVLSVSGWPRIFDQLEEIGLKVDFNQGLDARYLTRKVAERLSNLKMGTIRLAYDSSNMKKHIKRAIEYLSEVGIRRRNIIVYTLYNYTDTPDDFFNRVADLLNWGVVSYPMRYEPLCTLEKNNYVSPKCDDKRLEMVAEARRVLGSSGAFPPYNGLIEKFNRANTFDGAFKLRPVNLKPSKSKLEIAPFMT